MHGDLGHTGRVKSRSKFLVFLAVAALFVSACGSTTVVARDDRPAGAADNDSASVDESATSSDETTTSDEVEEPDDRGERDTDDAEVEAPDADATPAPPRAVEEDNAFGAGGTEQVEGLVADCIDGSDLACDILYQLTAFDSPEEEIALTCGGRSLVEVIFCTEGVEATDSTSFDPTSEALPQLATDCEEGDMTACDFLFFRSPIGSEWEDIGNTCAGRTKVALPDCRTQFGDE